MSNLTDVVKALTELSAALRAAARNAATAAPPEDDRYYDGKVMAYHDAAGMVDSVMVGPVMTAALLEMEAKAAGADDWQCVDQAAAVAFVDKLTKGNSQ